MQINKTDVIWNYLATFFKIATSIILLPLILRFLSSEEVAIWTIFSTISSLVFLLDFGFHSSFVRNVSYVFSGVQFLEKEGISDDVKFSETINYGLFKGVLNAMRWFYRRVSVCLFLILVTVGSFYLSIVLKTYSGDKLSIWIAWLLFCFINTYNLYTLYYESLMEGRGLIRLSKRITILGNIIYLIVAILLVVNNFGLVAIVFSQLLSILVIRFLSQKYFFDKKLVAHLKGVKAEPFGHIIKTIYPNAYKYGVTSLGGFLIQKAAIFIGSIYLPLNLIASFGVSKQIFDILVIIANITLSTYLPKITQLRIERNNEMIKFIYIRGIMVANLLFIIGAVSFIFIGPYLLEIISSKTSFASIDILLLMSLSAIIGLNAGISGAVVATTNVIPFMKPSIYSGIATVILLLYIFNLTNLGLIGLAFAPGLIDLCYQGWKWPSMVWNDLGIKGSDIKVTLNKIFDSV